MVQKRDVVIIGGGLAGLVAANFLANTGLSILMLEKGKQVGGRARTDQMKNHLFNLGPHAIYKKGKAKQFLEQLGIQLHGKPPILGGMLFEGEQQYEAPFNPISTLKTTFFSWKERFEWMKVLLKILSTNPNQLSQLTFSNWVEQTSKSNNVQSLLFTLGRLATYSNSPSQASAKVIVSQLKSVISGVIYLDGGWQTIIDQLHNKAIISGVEIQSHQTIRKITPNETSPIELTLSNDEVILAKHVIYTAGPKELLEMLGEHAPSTLQNSISQFIPIKGATLDVALSKLPNPKKLFALGLKKSLYYSVHSLFARLTDDPKNAVLHVYKYYEPNEPIDAKAVKTELEGFLETIQPGWKDYEITSRFIPQITVSHRLPQIGDEQKLDSSKSVIQGLYLAGDWVSQDLVLSDAAVESAKQAAFAIIHKEKS